MMLHNHLHTVLHAFSHTLVGLVLVVVLFDAVAMLAGESALQLFHNSNIVGRMSYSVKISIRRWSPPTKIA